MKGKLSVIGFGPGSFEHITKRAREAIQESDVVIGYNTYVDLIRGLLNEQQVVRTGMTEEVSRAQEAVRQAEAGKRVAVISSGDAGVYGMAGLIYEVLMEKGWRREEGVEVEIVPGISAINSVASLLGAPVMHDACTISLSDHLTPWEIIIRRVEAAASADFVIALYNPRSGRRTRQIVETQRVLLQYRSPDTPVGIVKSAYRERQDVIVTTLGKMLEHDIGMLTTVIIGNSTTVVYDGLIITPRGYQRKYTLDADVQPLRPHERLRTEAEPWSLDAQQEEASKSTGEENEALVVESRSDGSSESMKGPYIVDSMLDPLGGPVYGSRTGGESPLALALEALGLVDAHRGVPESAQGERSGLLFKQEQILEFAVSPGLAEKKLTAQQLMLLAEVVGEHGTMEYTPHHQMFVRIATSEPESVTGRLRAVGLLLAPVGDVAQIKACDFCNMDKADSVPYAEELHHRLGGMRVPKELKIGFNGCGMACYGAVKEDIGIVYRREKFDLFLGGKTVGRNAHVAQPVAEGIEPERLVETIERIVARYAADGHPNERFHKFYKRIKELEGYRHQEVPAFQIENAVCGD
ncbi:precorrin-3B C17-methyltransferase [Paenibacillus tianmuensis]|uniref:Precorrin-3B C17-methyltransferase n=1 Tax=Paenibacillus tianmuensis TaxID=624147 RepID=A0A1G4RJH4_9BACL|nr:precorrin-3B C(17)-methyltransferase [Paenibacillus tianmuensis]SCW57082.1 precorrin-3B C17-methyltransferase [Paenibacillus tianmuensis]